MGGVLRIWRLFTLYFNHFCRNCVLTNICAEFNVPMVIHLDGTSVFIMAFSFRITAAILLGMDLFRYDSLIYPFDPTVAQTQYCTACIKIVYALDARNWLQMDRRTDTLFHGEVYEDAFKRENAGIF